MGDDFHDALITPHGARIVLGPDGVRHLPEGRNPPLGLAELTGSGPARISRVPLAPGETVLLVTEGVTEARDRQGEFFPLTARARGLVASDTGRRTTAPGALLDRLVGDLADHTAGHLTDDATLLAVRRTA